MEMNHAPVKHVVIIVKENHTFDNYFGSFPGAVGEGLPKAADPPQLHPPDPPHDHRAWLKAKSAAQGGGKFGGVRQGYGKGDIPAYWAYAQNYVLCDNYYTDVASQSEPNHLYLIAADSPIIDNSSASRTYQPEPPFAMPSLPEHLKAAGREWRNYADPNASYFEHIAALQGDAWNVPGAQFDTDAQSGKLPAVSWLYAPEGSSEHLA